MTPGLGASIERAGDAGSDASLLTAPPVERLNLRRASVVAIAVCLGIGLAESLNDWLLRYFGGTPKSVSFVIVEQMPWWMLWTLFMPAIMWLARGYRFDNARWRRSAVFHSTLGLGIAIAHGALYGAFFQVTNGSIPNVTTIPESIRWFLLRYLFMDVMTYCAAVGVYYSFEYFSSFRHSALAGARSEARAARLELHLAQARLHALRMELNPHFLFNALNAVAGLVRRREPDKAIETLTRLGDLLRATLDGEMPSEVPLADELELLGRFLDIEQVRFGDRLRVAWDVEPGTRSGLVPPLILQPLVENALRHGIAQRPGPGLLCIAAKRDGDRLELTVRDSGRGLATANGRGLREGIGLSNTRARLEQLYGRHEVAMELADVAAGGAQARVVLPFHESPAMTHVSIGASA